MCGTLDLGALLHSLRPHPPQQSHLGGEVEKEYKRWRTEWKGREGGERGNRREGYGGERGNGRVRDKKGERERK